MRRDDDEIPRAGELIARCPDSHAEIATKLGVDKSYVTRLRSGTRKPSDEHMARLLDLYAAYGYRARCTASDVENDDERAGSNNDRLHRCIRDGMRDLEHDSTLSSVKRAEALKKLVDAQVALKRSTVDDTLTVAHVVAHPEFKRCVQVILEAIAPFPDAFQAVLAALGLPREG